MRAVASKAHSGNFGSRNQTRLCLSVRRGVVTEAARLDASARPVPRPHLAWVSCGYIPRYSLFFSKVVRVDSLDFVGTDRCDPDIVVDHVLRKLLPVNQNDLRFDARSVFVSIPREI